MGTPIPVKSSRVIAPSGTVISCACDKDSRGCTSKSGWLNALRIALRRSITPWRSNSFERRWSAPRRRATSGVCSPCSSRARSSTISSYSRALSSPRSIWARSRWPPTSAMRVSISANCVCRGAGSASSGSAAICSCTAARSAYKSPNCGRGAGILDTGCPKRSVSGPAGASPRISRSTARVSCSASAASTRSSNAARSVSSAAAPRARRPMAKSSTP